MRDNIRRTTNDNVTNVNAWHHQRDTTQIVGRILGYVLLIAGSAVVLSLAAAFIVTLWRYVLGA